MSGQLDASQWADKYSCILRPHLWPLTFKQFSRLISEKPILGIDFDGTLALTHVVSDPADLDAHQVEHVASSLESYVKSFHTFIVSARAFCLESATAIQQALLDFGVSIDTMNQICISNIKPPCHVYIDDRVWLFKGTFPSVSELLSFTPWHGRRILDDE